jgi:hypothetical protein
MASPKETTINTRTVAGRTVEIVRLDWPDGGILYDVYQQTPGGLDLLTSDESLDHIPADEEIRNLVKDDFLEEAWFTWKERRLLEGRMRLLTPWSDPAEHEAPFDLLFKTAEEARTAREEHDAENEPWVLVRVTLEEVDERLASGPVPAKATVVRVDPGSVVDVEGYGRRLIDSSDLRLVEAPEHQPTTVLAEVGSVLFVSGHGHQLIELEPDWDSKGFYPSLTALPVSD